MKRDELRRRLEQVEIPGEDEARTRSWELVSAAFAEREPVPRRRARLRPLLALAAAVALVAAALSPPGRAVIDTVREAIVGVEDAEPALFGLPAEGRLLVGTPSGSWVVQSDGSKRLLPGFRDASWSPHGLFVVAVRGRELVALEPGGRVRWSLARPAVRHPRWGGTSTDTRIAYLSEGSLRVVAGDGMDDDVVVPRGIAPVPPAWRPGEPHVLAYALADSTIAVLDVDARRLIWMSGLDTTPRSLAWSPDGRRLLVVTDERLVSFEWNRPQAVATRELPGIAHVDFAPAGLQVAVVRSGEVLLLDADRLGAPPRRLFAGPGRFSSAAWSPDGRWLILPWREADQLLFLRPGSGTVEAVSNITRQFGAFPSLRGWCCPAEMPLADAAPEAANPATRGTARRTAAAANANQPARLPALADPQVVWRQSTALGLPHAGRLVDGVELPREGPTFFTWDPVRKVSPNPRWRRYGTDGVVRRVLRILEEHAAANSGAPRVGVGDLSRPQGGPFGPKHASHQNGLDVDVYFPRLDRRERPPDRPRQIDRRLAQDLVDRFVAAGAERVFVGPRTGLKGPPGIVQVLANHDNHLHARFPNGRR